MVTVKASDGQESEHSTKEVASRWSVRFMALVKELLSFNPVIVGFEFLNDNEEPIWFGINCFVQNYHKISVSIWEASEMFPTQESRLIS